MINFFKLNDPAKLLVILALLFLFRLPVFIVGYDLLNAEFSWMLIGEKLNQGMLMYKDIQSTLGLLSAWTYQFIDYLFGRSQMAYQLMATILVGIQAMSINLYFNQAGITKEKSCIPAFLYVLISFSFFDFYTLSPVLLSLTFLIPALGHLFCIMKAGSDVQSVLKLGVFLGLSSLFYFPSFTLLFTFLMAFLLFTKTNIRYYVLLLIAYWFPVFLFGIYFYWIGHFDTYLYDILYYSLSLQKVFHMNYAEIITVLLPLVTISTIAVFRVLTDTHFVSFQQRCSAVMMLWIISSGVSVLLCTHVSVYDCMLFFPPCVYFITQLFFVVKKRWFRFLYFDGLLFCILGTAYLGVFFPLPKMVYDSRMFVNDSPVANSSKKVLVLGDDLSHYRGNVAATSLINWHLDKRLFKDFSMYDNVISVKNKLEKDPPEIIVDQHDNMPKIMERIPQLAKYRKGNDGFYYLEE